MLNYVWVGLIVCALLFALANDIGDLHRDTYANGRPLAVTITGRGATVGHDTPVEVVVADDEYRAHFKTTDAPPATMPATITPLEHGYRVTFAATAPLTPRLAAMRTIDDGEAKPLQATLPNLSASPGVDGAMRTELLLPTTRFLKLRAITQAALDMSKTAVLTVTFGLIGALALWLGIMRIAESCGLIEKMVKIIQPLLRPLFPEVPHDHPAMGYIAVNLAGNILGLGNATTAMGLKAMEELQTLNPSKDTASNSMVMLLALHTAAFQLVPPATLIAVMGFSAMEVFIPMLLVGLMATVIAALAANLLGRLPMYRRSDPMRLLDQGQRPTG